MIDHKKYPGFGQFLREQDLESRNSEKFADTEITKTITYVTGGALALSITFYLNAGVQLKNLPCLIASWSLLILTLMLNTIAYHLQRTWSASSSVKITEMVNPSTVEKTPGDWDTQIEKDNRKWKWLTCGNHLIIVLFVLGILSLGSFIILNVMSKNGI